MKHVLYGIIQKFYKWARKNAMKVMVIGATLILFDSAFIIRIAGGGASAYSGVYFLNVGQGDSELIVFPDGVKFLVDGGPVQGSAYEAVGNILPSEDRYIDLVMMSHPQIDHYGGLTDIVRRYRVGAFVSNGEVSESDSFTALEGELIAQNISRVVLRAGDVIRHGEDFFTVLSPARAGEGATANDDALVGDLSFSGAHLFFAADADGSVEEEVLRKWNSQIDVLKVAHHGSRYGSTATFLTATRPRVAVIEVGRNSYGHPAPETLARLADAGARIFRTDQEGTILVRFESGVIKIFSLRQ